MLLRNGFHADVAWTEALRLRKLPPAYSTPTGVLFGIDALKMLQALPSNSVDLVMTSNPPSVQYATNYMGPASCTL